jgi:transposase-like protein
MSETKHDRDKPSQEVEEKATRRQYTAAYKLDILRRADACTKAGELGALLRAEGLYSSHLATWRRQREAGELAGLTPRKRGRKPTPPDPRERRIADLEKENRRLLVRAQRAEAIVELQKKVSDILGIKLPDPEGKP